MKYGVSILKILSGCQNDEVEEYSVSWGKMLLTYWQIEEARFLSSRFDIIPF